MDFFKTFFDYQTFIDTLLRTVWDVLPIAAVLFLFQWFVIRKPLPHPRKLILGFLLVLVGLAFFLEGLEMALFPVGKLMAQQLTNPVFLYGAIENIPESLRWHDFLWVYLFGAAIGFACTIAEPALIAVSIKAEEVSGGAIRSQGLRIAVAMGAATGIALGTHRIVTGIPLHYYIIVGYVVVIVQTVFAPRKICGLAYDSGGVTTSTVTVPVVAALGLGLATTIPGRSALLDGFGLIALTALFPIVTVLGYGQIAEWWARANAWKETALHRAAFSGDQVLAKKLIDAGDKVNAKGADGAAPLHRAAFRGHVAVTELLLSRGAKVDIKNKEGRTPLHRAAFKGHDVVVGLLLAGGANATVGDKEGRTPLHRAAFGGRKDVAELLLASGAKVDVRNKEGRTPLHRAAFKGHTDVAELLLARGAEVDAKDDEGLTPLHRAACAGREGVAELLLARGAEIDAEDKRGWTPLHQACFNGRRTVAKLLLTRGARVDAKDREGQTPMLLAAAEGHMNVAGLFVASSADVVGDKISGQER